MSTNYRDVWMCVFQELVGTYGEINIYVTKGAHYRNYHEINPYNVLESDIAKHFAAKTFRMKCLKT